MQSANNSQHNQTLRNDVCTFSLRVQQSSYHLCTVRGNFLCGSADEVSAQKRASNWISELLLKSAAVGGKAQWKRSVNSCVMVQVGNCSHICQPSALDCTVCLTKERAGKSSKEPSHAHVRTNVSMVWHKGIVWKVSPLQWWRANVWSTSQHFCAVLHVETLYFSLFCQLTTHNAINFKILLF